MARSMSDTMRLLPPSPRWAEESDFRCETGGTKSAGENEQIRQPDMMLGEDSAATV